MFSAIDLRSTSGATNLATPPSRPQPSAFGNRPLGVKQPSQAVDRLASEEMEIPQSPSTVRASRPASLERYRNDGDSSERPTAPVAVSQVVPAHAEVEDQPDWQEQGGGMPNGGDGNFLSSRQSDTPVASSPVPILESGTILEGLNAKAM